jgi:hypothetical protein
MQTMSTPPCADADQQDLRIGENERSSAVRMLYQVACSPVWWDRRPRSRAAYEQGLGGVTSAMMPK